MSGQILSNASALALAALGAGLLFCRRRARSRRGPGSLLGKGASWSAGACLVGAGGLVLYAWLFLQHGALPRTSADAAPQRAVADGASDSPTEYVDPDERLRRLAVGTWTDNYRGKRTLTLREDGTGTMLVELQGLAATLYASRLRFEMTWSVHDGRMKKQSIGGEPSAKVKLLLKATGDRVDQQILEIDRQHMVLLHEDGTTEFNWTRVE